jgi:hypothetical protein
MLTLPAEVYGWLWATLVDLLGSGWLSFVLAGVIFTLPSRLAALAETRSRYIHRAVKAWADDASARITAAGPDEVYSSWRKRRLDFISLRLEVLTPRPSLLGSTVSAAKTLGFLALPLLALAGAWALLTEPLSIVSEGSGLWTLFCGDAATRAGCEPGGPLLAGLDLRLSPLEAAHPLGWALIAANAIGLAMTLHLTAADAAHPLRKIQDTIYMIGPHLTDWRPSIQTRTWLQGLSLGFAWVLASLPTGVALLTLVSTLLGGLTAVLMQRYTDKASDRWDAFVEMLMLRLRQEPSFFEPVALDVMDKVHRGADLQAAVRLAMTRLIHRGRMQLLDQAGDGQPALSERLSLVETGTGIRMLLKPEPTGNVMVFLAEDAEAAHMIMQTLDGPHDFKVDGFPVLITELVVSDYLVDGRAVPEL